MSLFSWIRSNLSLKLKQERTLISYSKAEFWDICRQKSPPKDALIIPKSTHVGVVSNQLGENMYVIQVASSDSCFHVIAKPATEGNLNPGDIILWMPLRYDEDAKQLLYQLVFVDNHNFNVDTRSSWIGWITAKIEPALYSDGKFYIIEKYV